MDIASLLVPTRRSPFLMPQPPPVSTAYTGQPPPTSVALVPTASAACATLHSAPPGIPPPPAPELGSLLSGPRAVPAKRRAAPHPAEPPAIRPSVEENFLVVAQAPPSDRMPDDMPSASPDPLSLERGCASRVMSSTEDKQLACPFYKLDPTRHRRCRRHTLRGVNHVNQHIGRAHTIPPHCQKCNKKFQTNNQLRKHTRVAACEPQPYTPPDGVTEDQLSQLHSRVWKKMSLEGRWYRVFRILFPQAPLPTSVYLDPEASEDLDDFFGFLTTNGPGIICGDNGTIERSQLPTALQKVVDQWRGRRAETRASSLPGSGTVERPRLPSTAVRGDTSPCEPRENRVKPISSLISHGSGETDA